MDSPTAKRILSPVQVQVSPSSQKVNLTGTARKLSDSAADLFNLIQRWNDLVLNGSQILGNVQEIKTPSLMRNEAGYSEGLQTLCDSLNDCVSQMEDIVGHMTTIKLHLEGIVRLEEFQKSKAPEFLTWHPIHFANLGADVLIAYSAELKTKRRIMETAAHCKSEKDMMCCRALWAYKINVKSNLEFRIEAMLKETGHR